MSERDNQLEIRLKTHLAGCRIGGTIHAFSSLGSTMEYAHTLAAEGAGEGTLIWAAQQEQGRGRLGRSWNSPLGGAYFSFILKPSRPLGEVPQLSLVTGLAAAETIQQLTTLFASIRWPNDLLINHRKVAGILVEAKNGAVIVGVGINVITDPAQLPETATSLAASGAKAPDPLELTAGLCQRFEAWYDVWAAKGFAPIREALRPWMGMFGQPVQIRTSIAARPRTTNHGPQQQTFEGVAQDIDEQGRLVVRLDSGILRTFDVGEVALLKRGTEA